MPEAIHRGRLVVGLLDVFVVVAFVLEIPDLDVVHCNAADPGSALLAEDGDGAFQVLGIGEHGTAHGAEGTAAPADVEHTGVFHLDVALKGGSHGVHALDRADQPIDQIDVMTGLVHEGAAIEFPGATPVGGIVVFLRAGPEHVDVDHVHLAKAALIEGTLQHLQGGVAAVLLDDKKADTGIVTGLDHPYTILPAGSHRLFCHDVDTVASAEDRLVRMKPTRCAQGNEVQLFVGEHVF